MTYNKKAEDWIGSEFELQVQPDALRCYLWWPEQQVWICSWPTEAVAREFILGDTNAEYPARVGFDRSYHELDMAAACHRYRERFGKFPQFEFNANATALDLYIALDLGIEYVSRLMLHDEGEHDAAAWGPLIEKLLGRSGDETAVLLDATTQTRAQKRLLVRWLQAQLDHDNAWQENPPQPPLSASLS